MAGKKKTTAPAQKATTAVQEGHEVQENIVQAQEGGAGQEATAAIQETQESKGSVPKPFAPYEATVAVPLVVIRRGKTPRPKDKPIGTMARGARVTVTASVDGFAMLANGTYVKEAYLERKA